MPLIVLCEVVLASVGREQGQERRGRVRRTHSCETSEAPKSLRSGGGTWLVTSFASPATASATVRAMPVEPSGVRSRRRVSKRVASAKWGGGRTLDLLLCVLAHVLDRVGCRLLAVWVDGAGACGRGKRGRCAELPPPGRRRRRRRWGGDEAAQGSGARRVQERAGRAAQDASREHSAGRNNRS